MRCTRQWSAAQHRNPQRDIGKRRRLTALLTQNHGRPCCPRKSSHHQLIPRKSEIHTLVLPVALSEAPGPATKRSGHQDGLLVRHASTSRRRPQETVLCCFASNSNSSHFSWDLIPKTGLSGYVGEFAARVAQYVKTCDLSRDRGKGDVDNESTFEIVAQTSTDCQRQAQHDLHDCQGVSNSNEWIPV